MLPTDAQLHRLSVEDVLRMYETGVLGELDRVELLDGVLVDKVMQGPSHSSAVAWLTRHFVEATTDLEVRVQDTLLVHGGFVEPDLMVIDPPPEETLPSTAHLVVEVSVTTTRYDRAKAVRYARADVGEYWIVDVPGRAVTVHLEPHEIGYGVVREYADGERIQPTVGDRDVAVSALLGRR
jgi:Uma2 family endonuclease